MVQPMLCNPAVAADFYAHKLEQSCRFNTNDSARLSQAQSAWAGFVGDFVLSVWVKCCKLGSIRGIINGYYSSAPSDLYSNFYFNTDNRLISYHFSNPNNYGKLWTPQYRDTLNWYHLYLIHNQSNATAADRLKLFVNGLEVTDVTTDYGNITATSVFHRNSTNYVRTIGAHYNGTWTYTDMYMSDFQLIQGRYDLGEVDPTDVGEFKKGIWIPKSFSKVWTGGEFHLDFSNSSHFGEDQSGNGNDFTDTGLATNDQVDDSPTNNYPVMNNLWRNGGVMTYHNGNLNPRVGSAAWYTTLATMALPISGKWYWEVNLPTSDVDYMYLGMVHEDNLWSYDGSGNSLGQTTDFGLRSAGANITVGENGNYHTIGAYVGGQNDVFQVAYDADAGKAWLGWYDNSTSTQYWIDASWGVTGNPSAGTDPTFTGLSGIYFPALCMYQNNGVHVDFGQQGFTRTPPTDFIALCSENLPEPSVIEANKGMDIKLWTGNITNRNITGLNFQPDLVWLKDRDNAARSHNLVDSVRGVTLELNSDGTDVETTVVDGLTAFISDGFSIGVNVEYNGDGDNFIAWCLRKGTTHGFDIISYTGTGTAHAESHGLGVIPELIIVKKRDIAVADWCVYHHHVLNKIDPETDGGVLNTAVVWADSNLYWNDVVPTSTQFTVGTGVTVNSNGAEYIAWLFKSIDGFSKVFSYEGNANADGPFVNCGFRPRFILAKNADAVASWLMFDTERSTYNPMSIFLYTNLPNAEVDDIAYAFDFLSNGFKLRHSAAVVNGNAQTMIGIAFAEHPFKYNNAR